MNDSEAPAKYNVTAVEAVLLEIAAENDEIVKPTPAALRAVELLA